MSVAPGQQRSVGPTRRNPHLNSFLIGRDAAGLNPPAPPDYRMSSRSGLPGDCVAGCGNKAMPRSRLATQLHNCQSWRAVSVRARIIGVQGTHLAKRGGWTPFETPADTEGG